MVSFYMVIGNENRRVNGFQTLETFPCSIFHLDLFGTFFVRLVSGAANAEQFPDNILSD